MVTPQFQHKTPSLTFISSNAWLQVSGTHAPKVWIVGDDLVCQLAKHAVESGAGMSLGLEAAGLRVRWIANKSHTLSTGMKALFRELDSATQPPSAIITHLGITDIGSTPHHKLRACLHKCQKQLSIAHPQVRWIWCNIPPPLSVPEARSPKRLDKMRQRVNNLAGKLAIAGGGAQLPAPFESAKDNYVLGESNMLNGTALEKMLASWVTHMPSALSQQ